MKNLYLFVGQSGVGKSTIAEKLEEKHGIKQVISYTTREPRYEGENTHIFISDKQFDRLENIVAFTEFAGHRYCATQEQLDGCDIYVIDPQGVDTLRVKYHERPLKIIYIKALAGIRYERMKDRLFKEHPDITLCSTSALDRIGHDAREFYFYEHGLTHIDFTIKNEGDIDETVKAIYDFIQEEENREEEVSDEVSD